MHKYKVIRNGCRGFNNCHLVLQTQLRVISMGLRQGSGLCSSSSRKYPGTEGRIRTAIVTITADMRNELDYRDDVCRITKGAHIEHLYGM